MGIIALVIEQVSPDDCFTTLVERVERFGKAGVTSIWWVDPTNRCIAVYRAGKTPDVFEGDEGLEAEEMGPGVRFRVSEFFAPAESKS